MKLILLKSKLHHIRVTDANLEYEGSMAIDRDLMDAAGLFPYEKLLIANLANGERFETYAIPGERGQRGASLNGAAAYKGSVGDRLIVMSFCQVDAEAAASHKPRVLTLDANNAVVKTA